jgi:hypothetical protein
MTRMPVNPYDFANPVNNMLLFADRIKEREEIDYYLDHATAAPQPISIALMGSRAAGKTSLLNYTEQEARKRDFLTVRINLDEDNVANVFSFFYKVFDSIFTEAVSKGCYEGFNGRVYETYLDITTAFKVDVDKVWMPFVFPAVYAKAAGSNAPATAQFPDNVFGKDLTTLQQAVGRPIILIFDECDLLSNARSILQKLRNTFMNLQGFMLVFSGTPQLFPVMDDVFSPIVRQFKKIPVREFGDKKDTEECIRKPLEQMQGDLPHEVFSLSSRFIEEVHELASGRPYEVQLLCHAMFKRIQAGRAKTMGLDLAVLEDVQLELAKEQDISSRKVLSAVRSLSDKQLKRLAPFCIFDSELSLEQIWQLESFLRKRDPMEKASLSAAFDEFVRLGILESKENSVRFCGDYFDRIFAKYYASEKRVSLGFSSINPDLLLATGIMRMLTESNRLDALHLGVGSLASDDVIGRIGEFVDKLADESHDAFVNEVRGLDSVYMMMMRLRRVTEVPIFVVSVRLPWVSVAITLGTSSEEYAVVADNAETELIALKSRADTVGAEVTHSTGMLKVAPYELLQSRLKTSENAKLRAEICKEHLSEMYDQYIEKRNLKEAAFHAASLVRLDYQPSEEEANNLGYVLLSLEQYGDAQKYFSIAKETDKTNNGRLLSTYNLGITELMGGRKQKAGELFEWCMEFGKGLPTRDRFVSCLFVPKVDGTGGVRLEETFDNPDVWRLAKVARQAIND